MLQFELLLEGFAQVFETLWNLEGGPMILSGVDTILFLLNRNWYLVIWDVLKSVNYCFCAVLFRQLINYMLLYGNKKLDEFDREEAIVSAFKF